ncbi:PLP-dependent transferase [Thermococcus sp. JCM 11816]|uniref:PLP-dependent transferase n=1 Tax=Thermococcus sp. (strain JCM 11816 / KS-1) TaxID=1295125 RepID=UPI000A487275
MSAAKTMPEERRRLLGITPGLIRLSVGVEDADLLIEDIDRALGGVVDIQVTTCPKDLLNGPCGGGAEREVRGGWKRMPPLGQDTGEVQR